MIYDRNGMTWSTRVWWLLRAYGFDDAGGARRRLAGLGRGPVSDRAGARSAPRRSRRAPRPELMADLRRGRRRARPACSTRSRPTSSAARRTATGAPGRIPGSVNVFAKELVDPRAAGCCPRTRCASASTRRRAGRRARRRVLRRGHLGDARRVRADAARGARRGRLRRLDVRVGRGSALAVGPG